MADIKTILRELSVIMGFIMAKFNIPWDYYDKMILINSIKKYCKNIDECESELAKLLVIGNLEPFQSIIQNGIKLGQLIFEALKLKGEISWVGSNVKLQYPFDIMVGEVGISLKEDSDILKNPSFADYLNALLQPEIKFTKIHVFRKYAPKPFNIWFDYTYQKLLEEYNSFSENENVHTYAKRRTFIKRTSGAFVFGSPIKTVSISINEPISEEQLNKKLGGFLFEHTVSKWIKHKLENKDRTYELLKKECSTAAGINLKKYILENLNVDRKKMLELFQIYDKSYYYGKSFGDTHLYRVPSWHEYEIELIDIEIKVPQSQLNVYFTFRFTFKNSSNAVNFRVECRYSHGQFKGIPEAKLYYTDKINHLRNLYEFIK